MRACFLRQIPHYSYSYRTRLPKHISHSAVKNIVHSHIHHGNSICENVMWLNKRTARYRHYGKMVPLKSSSIFCTNR